MDADVGTCDVFGQLKWIKIQLFADGKTDGVFSGGGVYKTWKDPSRTDRLSPG